MVCIDTPCGLTMYVLHTLHGNVFKNEWVYCMWEKIMCMYLEYNISVCERDQLSVWKITMAYVGEYQNEREREPIVFVCQYNILWRRGWLCVWQREHAVLNCGEYFKKEGSLIQWVSSHVQFLIGWRLVGYKLSLCQVIVCLKWDCNFWNKK